jgi:hypothetical protein
MALMTVALDPKDWNLMSFSLLHYTTDEDTDLTDLCIQVCCDLNLSLLQFFHSLLFQIWLLAYPNNTMAKPEQEINFNQNMYILIYCIYFYILKCYVLFKL